jgi:hypothetical protein
MSTLGKSAESLIEILNLCEQTLAAFDAPNGTNDPLPFPVKARVPALQRHGQFGRRFALIKGGLSQPDGVAKIS